MLRTERSWGIFVLPARCSCNIDEADSFLRVDQQMAPWDLLWLFSLQPKQIPETQKILGVMMVRWLYNSDGDPVAFIAGKHAFTQKGGFIGMLYPDNTIWNGDYVGTVMADDRLFYDERSLHLDRGIPGTPGLPPFVAEPMLKGPFTCPLGYRDVDF